MAKKGQKYSKYSEETKMQIVNEYLEGHNGGSKSLSKKYGISYRTIDTWIYTYKRKGSLSDRNKFKGRLKEENIDYKERYEILKKYQAFLKAQRERK
jgi:transposase-like protein